jgi:hypothetical protein
MLFLFIASLIFTLISYSLNSYCGLLIPDTPQDCYQWTNDFYTCCYVELSFPNYSPKACYGVLNAWNQTFPATITQFNITTYSCGASKPQIVKDNMLCGNNITSKGPSDCLLSSGNNTNCCEFTYDNVGLCVDTTTLTSTMRNTMMDSIVCGSNYYVLSFLIYLYILLLAN